ncbi:MAG: hypothetical protein IIZ74_03185 [Erysipelotrichaceae bacterium]|jgi:hypothetical protein|nr:hypothetical protein [Erysipelotrichaceae bacterium]MBQ3385187.1 hypothetical protein [Erysipelotrichaceae bacterium]MBR2701595.1 hypothetical protein [Erysipelotrichaceae bacterium]
MKSITFKEAITYLKDGEIVLAGNRTSFYLDGDMITVHTPNSRYKLSLNEFRDLFVREQLYLYIPNSDGIDTEKDDAYYAWKRKNAN